MAFVGNRDAFFVVIIVSIVSDLIDGPIARWSGQASEFGAKLDTLADACTVLVGILGLYVLERNTLRPELPWFCLFLAAYGAAAITCLTKFGKLPAYHLYLSKIANFFAGVFVVWLYMIDYSRAFFLSVVSLGVLANLESLLTTLRLRRFRSDVGSLFLLGEKG
jgi:cardiolipin synthase (CMP-forming)